MWCRVIITEHRVYSHLYQALPYYNKQTLSCLNWLESSRAITNHQLNRYNRTISSSDNMYLWESKTQTKSRINWVAGAAKQKPSYCRSDSTQRKYTSISKRSSVFLYCEIIINMVACLSVYNYASFQILWQPRIFCKSSDAKAYKCVTKIEFQRKLWTVLFMQKLSSVICYILMTKPVDREMEFVLC